MVFSYTMIHSVCTIQFVFDTTEQTKPKKKKAHWHNRTHCVLVSIVSVHGSVSEKGRLCACVRWCAKSANIFVVLNDFTVCLWQFRFIKEQTFAIYFGVFDPF